MGGSSLPSTDYQFPPLWAASILLYSGNFSRTINFAVFMDFTATSKINPLKSYHSIQMQLVDPRNLIREMF